MKRIIMTICIIALSCCFISCKEERDDNYYLEEDTNTPVPVEEGTVNEFIEGIDTYNEAWIAARAWQEIINVDMNILLSRKFFRNILTAKTIPYEKKEIESQYMINFAGNKSDTYICHFLVFTYRDGIRGLKFGIRIFTNESEQSYSIESSKDIKALYDFLEDAENTFYNTRYLKK